jgi:hypothetical protein
MVKVLLEPQASSVFTVLRLLAVYCRVSHHLCIIGIVHYSKRKGSLSCSELHLLLQVKSLCCVGKV